MLWHDSRCINRRQQQRYGGMIRGFRLLLTGSGILLLMCHKISLMRSICTVKNSWTSMPPIWLPTEETEVIFVRGKDNTSINTDPQNSIATLKKGKVPLYNEANPSNSTKLSRTWRIHMASDREFTKNQVDANSCFERQSNLPEFSSLGECGDDAAHLSSLSSSSLQCLPALYVIGFEKTGTTVLNIWLSYHPNIRTHLMEGRFFDDQQKQQRRDQRPPGEDEILERLDSSWHEYLGTLPSTPRSQIGHVWTMEKSPAYAQNPFAPAILSSLVPSARLIVVTRNPTQRAYSMFLMYTHHYPDTISALRQRPLSYFVKNHLTGDVRHIADGFSDWHPKGASHRKTPPLPPGEGGSPVPLAVAPPSAEATNKRIQNSTLALNGESRGNSMLGKPGEWHYLSYPPMPTDFDRYIRLTIAKHNRRNRPKTYQHNSSSSFPAPFLKEMNGRAQRILTGGLYGPYLQRWMGHFPPQSLVVVPSESFFATDQAIDSMADLQRTLGLPHLDYRTLVQKDPESGRYEIPNSLATLLNRHLNDQKTSANTARRMSEDVNKQKEEATLEQVQPMLLGTKDLLDNFYCESNRQLKQLLAGNDASSALQLSSYSCWGDQ